jgi:hypothetical protein
MGCSPLGIAMGPIAKCADKRVIDEALKRIGMELFEIIPTRSAFARAIKRSYTLNLLPNDHTGYLKFGYLKSII